jgi:hypothetical protein
LILVAGVLVWLNFRVTADQTWLGHIEPPDELNPLTRSLFFRGWPLSPWMLCPFHGMKWHPEEIFCELALVLDAVVALLVLAALGYACEWWVRGRRRNP